MRSGCSGYCRRVWQARRSHTTLAVHDYSDTNWLLHQHVLEGSVEQEHVQYCGGSGPSGLHVSVGGRAHFRVSVCHLCYYDDRAKRHIAPDLHGLANLLHSRSTYNIDVSGLRGFSYGGNGTHHA